MSCFHPVSAFLTKAGDVVFNELARYGDLQPMQVPCGRCVGCRTRRAAEWADRCVHESQMHKANCFVTLTYDDPHLPSDGSLDHSHFQAFIHRLRRKHRGVSYYMCGEYGPELGRPHFHACLFGVNFFDRTPWRKSAAGEPTFRSAELDRYWPGGIATVQDFNRQTAGYVSNYIMQKITGQMADLWYGDRLPEYNRMSLRPGVGQRWFQRYRDDLRHDYVVCNGRQAQVPRYYDKLRKRVDPAGLAEAKDRRAAGASLRFADNTVERQAVKEAVQVARLNRHERSYE